MARSDAVGAAAQRLTSLDAFRGLTVAAMILVNNPGDAGNVYAPLQHAEWNGWTVTDLIFPFFLFITGTAIPLSLAPKLSGASIRRVEGHIIRRSLLIFALGLFLNGFPMLDWSTLRIPGVLQRIAVCYAAAAFLVLHTRPRTLGLLCATIIVSDVLLIIATGGASVSGPDASPLATIDGRWLPGHLLHDDWDPEGIASTLPALATTLLGVLAGYWLRAAPSRTRCSRGLISSGTAAMAGALVLDRWCPINKTLWSGSFVLLSGGAAALGLGVTYWLLEIRAYTRWATPFVAFGRNPIVAYVLSTLVTKELWLLQMPLADGTSQPATQFLFEHLFLPLAQPHTASLLYAVTHTLLWMLVAVWLYRQRILIKI